MKNNDDTQIAVSLLFFVCVFVTCLGSMLLKAYPPRKPKDSLEYCASLSSGIDSQDLIGTWIAKSGTGVDKIIIQPDHTYSQVYSDPVTQISFTTNLNTWELSSKDGVTYMHLSGMHKCDSFETICLLPNGGGGDEFLINFCTGEVVQMQNSVTLIVLRVVPGNIYYPLSDLELCHFLSDPDGSAVCFIRETE